MASAQSSEDMDKDDLTRTDRAILDVLKRGRDGEEPWGMATKGMLIDRTGFSRNSVYNRLEVLKEAGFVELVHNPTKLYRFVSDPREPPDEGADDDAVPEDAEVETDGGELHIGEPCPWCGEDVPDANAAMAHLETCAPDE